MSNVLYNSATRCAGMVSRQGRSGARWLMLFQVWSQTSYLMHGATAAHDRLSGRSVMLGRVVVRNGWPLSGQGWVEIIKFLVFYDVSVLDAFVLLSVWFQFSLSVYVLNELRALPVGLYSCCTAQIPLRFPFICRSLQLMFCRVDDKMCIVWCRISRQIQWCVFCIRHVSVSSLRVQWKPDRRVCH